MQSSQTDRDALDVLHFQLLADDVTWQRSLVALLQTVVIAPYPGPGFGASLQSDAVDRS